MSSEVKKSTLEQLFSSRSGEYGQHGGAYIPEIFKNCFDELTEEFYRAVDDPTFYPEYEKLMKEFSCRPTPITYLKNISEHLGGAKIFVKREDLNHTGAHKLNNVMGQGLLVQRMGKKRVIAETGAGQHGVATATMAAKFGFECRVYMGEEDVQRQRPNVFWMEKMGAEVFPVSSGSKTLKDAINESFRDWAATMDDTHYVLGTVCGPHPYPEMVTYFQAIIGREAREQMITMNNGKGPDRVFACVGGGSNAMGIFSGFFDEAAELIGVEAGGKGLASGQHASRISGGQGTLGVSGYKTYFLQNDDGQMLDTHSIAAGLDYVGVSPILAHLADIGKVRFESATDEEVRHALELTMRQEGLVPALESTHAFVAAYREAPSMRKDQSILINMSGRGDKDIFTVAEALGDEEWKDYLKFKAGL